MIRECARWACRCTQGGFSLVCLGTGGTWTVCVANSQTFLGNGINPGQLAHATMARPASSGWKQLGSAPVCCLLYTLGRHPQCPGCSWCWQPVQEERDACAAALLSHCAPTAMARAQPLLLPTFSLWGTPHSFLMYFFLVIRDTLTTVGHRMDVKALAAGWLMCGCLPFRCRQEWG